MKMGIVGGRDFTDYEIFKRYITEFFNVDDIELIVSGGAKGADTLAEQFADEYNIETLIFKPDYKKHGRGACHIRNTSIVDNSDILVAFWDGQSTGTKDSVTKAKKMGKDVHICPY